MKKNASVSDCLLMHPCRIPAIPKPLRRLHLVVGSLLMTGTSACAPGATRPAVLPPVAQRTVGVPDLVTVVPFQLDEELILLPAEVDGRRGTFVLDTGSPYSVILNGDDVRPGTNGRLDTIADAKHEGDTARPEAAVSWTMQAMRLGTLRQHLDTATIGTPVPSSPNGLIMTTSRFSAFHQSVLGNLGIPAIAPFETIIDYPHQRLILIRLDAAGHRLAVVPAFTPATTLPLLPYDRGHWGVRVQIGTHQGLFGLDTGSPWNDLSGRAEKLVTSHLVFAGQNSDAQDIYALDHLGIAGHVFDGVKFNLGEGVNLLGYPFLRSCGVVGFNFRTRQLILYR